MHLLIIKSAAYKISHQVVTTDGPGPLSTRLIAHRNPSGVRAAEMRVGPPIDAEEEAAEDRGATHAHGNTLEVPRLGLDRPLG